MPPSIWPSCIRGGHRSSNTWGMSRCPAWPSPGIQTCRACPAIGRRRQFYGKSFLSYVYLEKEPLHSSDPVSALCCYSFSPLLLTDKAHLTGYGCTATWSFCQMSLHSPFPGPPRALSLQKSLKWEWEASYRHWELEPRWMHLQTWKIPFCILPKHLTRIKVPPRGTNFTYWNQTFFLLILSLSVSDSKGMISSEIKPLVLKVPW